MRDYLKSRMPKIDLLSFSIGLAVGVMIPAWIIILRMAWA